MNENDIAKIIKKMPKDLVAESARFADRGVKTTQPAKKNTRGEFFRHPVYSIALSVALIAVCAAVAVGIVLAKRRGSTNDPGRNDPAVTGTDVITSAPEATPEAPVLIDVSDLVGEEQLGFGRMSGGGKSKDALDDLFDAYLAAYEIGETGPKYKYHSNYVLNDEIIDRITEFRNEAFMRNEFTEMTPREIEGTARLFTYDFDNFKRSYSVFLIDGKAVFVPEGIGMRVTAAVSYDYDGNGVGDLLLKVLGPTDDDNIRRTSYCVYDTVKKEYIEICAFYIDVNSKLLPEILESGEHVYITGRWDRQDLRGGEIVYKNGTFTAGGVAPMTLIRTLIGDDCLGAAPPYAAPAADPSGTSAPATPGGEQRTAELTDLSMAAPVHGELYDFGLLELHDRTDLTEFTEKWNAYVDAYLQSVSEFPGEPAPELLEHCEKLRLSVTSSSACWMDISPKGINGIGQIMRCEYLRSEDSDIGSFTLDVLLADGGIQYVFSEPGASRTVSHIVPLKLANSEKLGLLAVSACSLENGNTEYVVCAYDPNTLKVTKVSPSVQWRHGIFVMSTEGTAYVYYGKNMQGGRVEFDGTVMMLGGVAPADFFETVFSAPAPASWVNPY